ncbi:hypothetical protein, conserved [Eimeria acervulina]|uniref:Ppg3 n=1 Tax=Eimeria acervulina TaxID=5801 RepID=U6GDJ6_EIMAC|nr:hypothetical protein, conserved [Eimeria acervulina]CDI78341.1 hypothetical protein, conserved [Eimeria acervulina]
MMQHLLAESASRETALNAAQATPTAASHAPAIPGVVVVAFAGDRESQNHRESANSRHRLDVRYRQQQAQQDQDQISQREQHYMDQLPPQTSSPLVLKGSVRYSFATRTVEGCQSQSLSNGPVHPDNFNSTAAARSKLSSCSGGSSLSRDSKGNRATAASFSLGEGSAPSCNGVSDSACRKLCGIEIGSSGSSSSGSSDGSSGSTINCSSKTRRGNSRSSSDGHYKIPPSSSGSAANTPSLVFTKEPFDGASRSVSPRDITFGSNTSNGKSSSNRSCRDNSSSVSGDSEKKQHISLLSASDIAVLLRDYAAFVQRTQRQLQQLQKLVQQQQCLGSTRVGLCEQTSTGKSPYVRQQCQGEQQHQQQQLDEARVLRRFIAEGAVVCRSLHSRLCLLLADAPSTAVAAAGGELMLRKLRRDFAQQQQQYAQMLRLLSSAEEVLCEPAESADQHEVEATLTSTSNTSSSSFGGNLPGPSSAGGPARIVWHSGHQGSPCSLPVDCLHFEDPQRQRQTKSISWVSEGNHLGTASCGAVDSCLQHAERSLWPHGSTGALPPLLIGPSDARRSAADDSPQDDLWEPAALIEVHEDYEKQQIISERKQQLQQLQQVEHCVTVLRELQLHVASDVDKGSQRLNAVEEETEAAADHTAAGVGELAAAARSKTRWWGVQGGGAAALVGVSVGAVAGGPIGAAVGAIVGAVAGLSSGAALRGRHRERVNAAERSVRRRRAQRLKRSSVTLATGAMNTTQSTAGRVAAPRSPNQTSGARTQAGAISCMPPLWNFGRDFRSSSGAGPCDAPATTEGRYPRPPPKAAESRGGTTAPRCVPWVGGPAHYEGAGAEAKGVLQVGQSNRAAGRRRQRNHAGPRLVAVQTTLGATGVLPVFQFFPG